MGRRRSSVAIVTNYCFEWDPAKAAANQRKHGVRFGQATTVFLDPRALSLFDDEHTATRREIAQYNG